MYRSARLGYADEGDLHGVALCTADSYVVELRTYSKQRADDAAAEPAAAGEPLSESK